MSTAPWREKAERMIAEMAREAYTRANQLPNGRWRKRHVPYTLPALADELVECLGTGDEVRAKALFVRTAYIPELTRG